ncbi:MAG TPA: hypothetical protein VNC79_03080 [Mycobacteriales bacterium]|nr:hypothetical protein [Mycobacteriales bacterium]
MRRQPDPAFLAVLEAQQEPLLRAARLLTGDWPAAEQLLRDTLAWAIGGWQSLTAGGTAPLRVRQRLISAYLADARAAEADEEPDEDYDEDYEDVDPQDAASAPPGDDDGSSGGADEPGDGDPAPGSASLVAALAVLSREDRVIVVSRYYLGLSAAEIGDVLDVDDEDVDATAVSVLAALRRSTVEVRGCE